MVTGATPTFTFIIKQLSTVFLCISIICGYPCIFPENNRKTTTTTTQKVILRGNVSKGYQTIGSVSIKGKGNERDG